MPRKKQPKPPQVKIQEIQVGLNPEQTKVLYTDNIIIHTNNYGVTFDVGQKVGHSNQIKIVSRFGMSRNHAKKFLEELGRLLAITEGTAQTTSSPTKH